MYLIILNILLEIKKKAKAVSYIIIGPYTSNLVPLVAQFGDDKTNIYLLSNIHLKPRIH